jgi:hypothetical protein
MTAKVEKNMEILVGMSINKKREDVQNIFSF